LKITNKSNKHIQKEKVKVLSYLVSCGTHSHKSGLAQFIVSIVLFIAVVLEIVFLAPYTVMNVLLIVVCLLVFINAFRYFLNQYYSLIV